MSSLIPTIISWIVFLSFIVIIPANSKNLEDTGSNFICSCKLNVSCSSFSEMFFPVLQWYFSNPVVWLLHFYLPLYLCEGRLEMTAVSMLIDLPVYGALIISIWSNCSEDLRLKVIGSTECTYNQIFSNNVTMHVMKTRHHENDPQI